MTAFRRVRDYLAAHRWSDLALLAVISLLAMRGWFNFQLPQGHDTLADALLAQASTQSVSLQGLLSGWSNDWFLGTPLFYVHAPLVSSLVKALSYVVGWMAAMKLLYLSFYVLSGVFAYLYVYELTRSRYASLAAGLAYTFLPYHVLEVAFEGHHGAFGLPYMLAPLLFLGLERLIKGPRAVYVLLNALGLAALVLTYPQVFPILIGPFYVLYAVVRTLQERRRGGAYLRAVSAAAAGTICLSLLLTAFWWLPLMADVRHFAATSFPLEASREYSATFAQAVTLRPDFCCAPGSAFGSAGSAFTEALRVLPLVMVLAGALLNRRNRYVWFFSAGLVLAIFLSMGPGSPIKLFSLAYRLVPFFSGLRTPWRFLLFGSLAYAVLIGFFVQAAVQWVRSVPPARVRGGAAAMSVLLLTLLVVLGNTWQETRTAFRTFALTPDQQSAYDWLKAQDAADYRITDLPFRTWAYTSDGTWAIAPTCWKWLHEKDNVYGGVPAAALARTGGTLELLNSSWEQGASLDQWLSLYGVRYVVCQTGGADADRVGADGGYSLAWSGEALRIYEASTFMPRVFAVTGSDRRDIPLGSAAIPGPAADGVASLALDDTHSRSAASSLSVRFQLAEGGQDWSVVHFDVSGMALDGDDVVRLGCYSERPLPEVRLTIDAIEADGSRYGMDLGAAGGIAAGWNDIELPLSLMLLRGSTDENLALDPVEVDQVWLGVREGGQPAEQRQFTLCFDSLALESASISTNMVFRRTGAARYAVQVNAPSPFRLILSEAYHPGWRATADGVSVPATVSYESVNGFDLPPGQYEVVLEFTPSPLRTAGSLVSIVSLAALLGAAVLLPIGARRIRSKDRRSVLQWHSSTKEGSGV